MAHFEKHSTSIKALIDVTEAMLNQMEKYNIDPETVTQRPEFTVFIHFLKSIIDGELDIPNDVTDAIRNKSEDLGFDINDIKKRLH
ncbi:MAG: hypothetical protein CBB97_25245 [Candidatus Endolissoclinum sp. TMED37]|nr:MAG: hypothetical protein CBB97_25245 [Candidatus Endolissoclinum sp. TMED37]|tara:strand:- start:134 stop:391 length:258 start_codon:yes stop_codon:yes gene_type:complete